MDHYYLGCQAFTKNFYSFLNHSDKEIHYLSEKMFCFHFKDYGCPKYQQIFLIVEKTCLLSWFRYIIRKKDFLKNKIGRRNKTLKRNYRIII